MTCGQGQPDSCRCDSRGWLVTQWDNDGIPLAQEPCNCAAEDYVEKRQAQSRALWDNIERRHREAERVAVELAQTQRLAHQLALANGPATLARRALLRIAALRRWVAARLVLRRWTRADERSWS